MGSHRLSTDRSLGIGRVNFGRECGQAILANPTYDPFQFVEPLWRDSDITFVNLESQLSDQKGETQSPKNRLIFTGPPGGADVLARAGIDVVSTANNHAWDYGRSALFETLDNLARAGVANVGTGKTFDAAYAPASSRSAFSSWALRSTWSRRVFATSLSGSRAATRPSCSSAAARSPPASRRSA